MKQPIKMMKNNDENLNTKNQTLFFGIPKGTFYKKSPWAGFVAEPREYSLIAAFLTRCGGDVVPRLSIPLKPWASAHRLHQ